MRGELIDLILDLRHRPGHDFIRQILRHDPSALWELSFAAILLLPQSPGK